MRRPTSTRLRASDGVTTAFELEVGTGDIDAWYRGRDGGQLINYGVSVGHIQVRMAVMRDTGAFLPTGPGAHQPASAAEIKDIVQRVAHGLDRGAVAIGAGFPYTPAASREELLALFTLAGQRQVPVHVHTRRGVAGVDEAVGLSRETKAPLHIVHVNSTSITATRDVLALIDKARASGMDVTTEAYPYTAGMTEIQSANLDEYDGASAERLAQLEWPVTGERLTAETFRKYRKTGGPVVLHTNSEEMVKAAVTSPLTMIASDAYWENGVGHPRTTGTYSKVLGRYVREERALTLMEAIRKMTLMPARRLEARVPAMQNERPAPRRGRRRHRDCRPGDGHRSLDLSRARAAASRDPSRDRQRRGRGLGRTAGAWRQAGQAGPRRRRSTLRSPADKSLSLKSTVR